MACGCEKDRRFLLGESMDPLKLKEAYCAAAGLATGSNEVFDPTKQALLRRVLSSSACSNSDEYCCARACANTKKAHNLKYYKNKMHR